RCLESQRRRRALRDAKISARVARRCAQRCRKLQICHSPRTDAILRRSEAASHQPRDVFERPGGRIRNRMHLRPAAEKQMSQPALKHFTREWRLDAIGVAIFIALTVLGYLMEFEPALRDREAMRAGLAELADKRETISHLQ